MTDAELTHLLKQSIRYQQRIKDLQEENALLRSRLDVLSLRRLKAEQQALVDDVPALLRRQAG